MLVFLYTKKDATLLKVSRRDLMTRQHRRYGVKAAGRPLT